MIDIAKGQIKQAQAKINQEQFEKLCALQCTKDEIAGMFDVCSDTLLNWCKETYNTDFSTIYKIKSQNGKISLRRAQYKLAVEKLNPTMLVWLGKQYLNQTEKVEAITNADVNLNNKLADLLQIKEEEQNDRLE